MKTVLRSLAGLSLALVLGCSNPTGAIDTGASGSIRVSFPQPSRSLIDIAFASTKSDFYQIIAYDSTGVTRYTIDSSGGASSSGGTLVNVVPGTYTVVAMAGLDVATSSSPRYPVLLGSAYQQNVVVASGANTTVNLTLTNALYDLHSSAATVAPGSAFIVTYSGDSGSPMLQNDFATLQTSLAASMTTTNTFGQSFSFVANLTAPSSGSETYQVGVNLVHVKDTGINVATNNLYSGCPANYWVFPGMDPMGNWATKSGGTVPITTTVTFTNLSIVIGLSWGAGR